MEKAKANRQTKMIGLRVSDELYGLLKGGAESEDISPTAYARLTLARALNYVEEVPETKSRRTLKPKPINNDMKAAIDVLGVLIDVNMDLSFLSRKLAEVNVLNPLRAEQILEQGKRIEMIRREIDVIRDHILGERT